MRNRRCLLRSQSGNAIVIVAGVMPLIVGAGAVGIDVASWAIERRHLQRAADTGAIAGANAVMQKFSASKAVDQTLRTTIEKDYNDQVALTSKLIENAPTVGSYAGDKTAVRVVLTSTPKLFFVPMFLSSPITMEAEATAKATPDPRYCMVALEEGPQAGFDFSGSAGINADCGMMTNSRAKPSPVVFAGNNASIKATEIGAVGPLPRVSNYTGDTRLLPYQTKLPDPYSAAPDASSYATNCGSSQIIEGSSWSNRTLAPRCWSGGLTIKTKVTLDGGIYVINGGVLDFAAGAEVTANGPVTFIMTGATPPTIATLSVSGNTIIKLDAPTTGPLKDLLFYQDRRARYLGTENKLTGNASSTLNGGIYFPGSNLQFTGNSGTTAICARMVALRVAMTGNSVANLSCSGSQRDSLFGERVRLVA